MNYCQEGCMIEERRWERAYAANEIRAYRANCRSIEARKPSAKVLDLFRSTIADTLDEAPCKPTALALCLEAGLRRHWRAERVPMGPIVGDDGYSYCGLEDSSADRDQQDFEEINALEREAARLIIAGNY
jgi:hypothetical protein